MVPEVKIRQEPGDRQVQEAGGMEQGIHHRRPGEPKMSAPETIGKNYKFEVVFTDNIPPTVQPMLVDQTGVR